MLAVKSVKQNYSPPEELLELLHTFKRMVNHCVAIGLVKNVSSLKMLSLLSYRELYRYDSPSYYKLCAISRAAGILASRKKSIRRGFVCKSPYTLKPQLASCYGFKVENGLLRVPLAPRRYHKIPLNRYTLSVISDPAIIVRSFTLTPTVVSLTVSKEVPETKCTSTAGVDRNLRNLTCGNEEEVVQYNLSETVRIAMNTRRIIASFKRDDARIRRRIASKYGRRRTARTNSILHAVTKRLVTTAASCREAIVLEDIRGIRRLYQRGNLQGRTRRARMNGWSFSEVQRQIEYKAKWAGLPVIHLTIPETRGTSTSCPRCGERLQSDENVRRKLWCRKCRWVMDRDVVAAINIARRGRLRFDRSLPDAQVKGGAAEAGKGNPMPTVIPRVDAPKSTCPTTS